MNTRKFILGMVDAALAAINTGNFIRKNIRLEKDVLYLGEEAVSLNDTNRLFVVGVGKCSSAAAAALEEVLGERLDGGMVLDVSLSKKLEKIKGYEGSHPLATPQNIDFTKKIISFLEKATEKDLILMIISGGGSALLCQPQGFTLEQESDIIKKLMASGANIREVNIIRKHLSLARGGFLAKYAYPARVISLVFSDVPGNKLEFIASGPTVKDTTTVKDAEKTAKKYGLDINFFIETPKEDKYFEKVKNIVFISNKIALKAMADFAVQNGYQSRIVTADLEGEAREVGRQIAEEIRKEKSKTVLFYGGETTVTLRQGHSAELSRSPQGKGGRNQELALSALRFIGPAETIVAFASDGRDNTDVAGAIADKLTQEKAEELGLDVEKYLVDNNSYEFFQKTGDFIQTGDTGSNVSDLIVAIKD